MMNDRAFNYYLKEQGINLNPNMIRTWKKEFIENAGRVFNERQSEKEIRRKEADLEKQKNQMLKTIGQLTLERDFLQDCFRQSGQPVTDNDQFRK